MKHIFDVLLCESSLFMSFLMYFRVCARVCAHVFACVCLCVKKHVRIEYIYRNNFVSVRISVMCLRNTLDW